MEIPGQISAEIDSLRLSLDEVWQIHAFIKSTDHY